MTLQLECYNDEQEGYLGDSDACNCKECKEQQAVSIIRSGAPL